MNNKNNSKLNKAYANIIKNALQGKNTKELQDEFYQIVSSELGAELKELSKTDQKKVKKNIDKFDKKLSQELELDILKDLSDDIYTKNEFKKEEQKLKKQVEKNNFDLQKEINKFKNHSKQKAVTNNITLKELMTSTVLLNESRKNNIQVKDIQLLDVEYDVIKETLLIKLNVFSKSQSNKVYNTSYSFYDVSDITSNIVKNNLFTIKEKNTKKTKEIIKPNLLKNGVLVACTCEDYQYTFSYSNYINKCHLGSIDSNFKQKPEERNPKIIKGLCRHLLSGILFLKSQELIK